MTPVELARLGAVEVTVKAMGDELASVIATAKDQAAGLSGAVTSGEHDLEGGVGHINLHRVIAIQGLYDDGRLDTTNQFYLTLVTHRLMGELQPIVFNFEADDLTILQLSLDHRQGSLDGQVHGHVESAAAHR